MVSGDGHEYEREIFLPVASGGGGFQFCVPPFFGQRHS
jgi:hypothetical protein